MNGLAPWERPGFFLVPLCASCKVPVERFHLNPGPVRLTVEAQCHGATETAAIPIEIAIRLIKAHRSFVMFRRTAGFNLVNGAVL